MKNKSILLSLLLITVSCSTLVIRPYEREYDDYRKTERTTYRFIAYPKERIRGDNVADILFERNRSRSADSTIIFWKVISTEPKLSLTHISYIKIDGEAFELKNQAIKQAGRVTTETYNNSILLNDSTRINSASTSISTQTRFYDMFVTRLPDQVIQKLRGASSVELRIYFGNQPYTLEVKRKKVQRIRQMLSE